MAGMGLPGLWLFLLLVVAASIGLAVGSIWLANRSGVPDHGTGYNASLSPFLTTVSLVYGALLGFTVVVAWEQFSSAEMNVTSESSTLATMYRQTVGMPTTSQAKMRQLLRTYTTAVQDEWDPRTRTDAAATARGAITDMYRVLGTQGQPEAANPLSGDFLGQLTVLTSQRNTRILDARPRIPGLLWTGLLFGGLVVLALLGFIRMDSKRGHILLSSAVAILLGLLLFVVYWLDHPFGHQLGVTPAPFQHSLEVFDGVDQAS
ncbi:DUF4239 domain-containing protein [Mycobacterium sp. EPa45]|uniref:bestrophin-like domain n=1 Tax=Mycobacterium sp. EPa45 TaxID=1545728 RepID=UPI000641CD83|nr:DUF4239 domain-containing protein [Mycobacterium sp. EPa45]AKK28732.1 hypothetical protein AB431_20990 [Mycobacterium sp. EPa45]